MKFDWDVLLDVKTYILKFQTILMSFGLLINFAYMNYSWFYMLYNLCTYMNYMWLSIWSTYMWQDTVWRCTLVMYMHIRAYWGVIMYSMPHFIIGRTWVVCFMLWCIEGAYRVRTKSSTHRFIRVFLLILMFGSIVFCFMIEDRIGVILLDPTNSKSSSQFFS